MNPPFGKFDDYQAQYETVFIPQKVNEGIHYLQNGMHQIVLIIEEYIQIPELTRKTGQLGLNILSFSSILKPKLEKHLQFCKEARNYTIFFKGFKSLDGLLNLKMSWKVIVLNISGMTLFIISIITLADRFGISHATVIKTKLAAIPILGILPYGGLLTISTSVMMSMVLHFSLGKKRSLAEEENALKTKKLAFWSQPIDLLKVQQKQAAYQEKVKQLTDEIKIFENIQKDGQNFEAVLLADHTKCKKLTACRKAIQELTLIIELKKENLNKYEKICSQWTILERNWVHINPQEIENFRLSKTEKWKAKLDKIDCEKKAVLFSMAVNVIVLTRQILTIGAAVTGLGLLPLIVIDAADAGCSIRSFFLKRHLQKMKTLSVDLATHVNLNYDGQIEKVEPNNANLLIEEIL